MERAVFDRMAEHDQVHWWYVARRRILAELIARHAAPPEGGRILEIGCGTGHNFDMLRAFGRLDAIEVDGEARALASRRLGHAVGSAPLPALDGVADRAYALVALLDVLEHIDDDVASLRSIAAKLAPGGKILLTVPANRWMWSAHDVVHHHKRRYSKASLQLTIKKAGLKPELVTHFNSLLFPLAAAARIAGKVAGKTASDDRLPPAPLNGLFTGIFGLERHLVGRVPLPFGVSLVAILTADQLRR
jgi:SAM-dependent methyltransferase